MLIREREVKRLYAVSGNRCAFTGCDQLPCEPGAAGEPGVVTDEMAHIVAVGRQGPCGRVLDEDTRNTAENLILLCERHQKIVDRRPRTYTVDTLIEMKRRREAPFLEAPVPTGPAAMVAEAMTYLRSIAVRPRLAVGIRHRFVFPAHASGLACAATGGSVLDVPAARPLWQGVANATRVGSPEGRYASG